MDARFRTGLEDRVEIEVAVHNGGEAVLVPVHFHVLEVDHVDAARKALDLARRRAAAELRPVHVEDEAPFSGSVSSAIQSIRHLFSELLVLKAVVVVVQLHAGVVQLVGRRGEVGQKRAHALERAGVFLRHHADADVLAAHDAVVFDDLLGVFEDELRVCA